MKPGQRPASSSVTSSRVNSQTDDTFLDYEYDENHISSTTTTIMPFSAATYVDPRASFQINTVDLAIAKSNAIKEYKNTPQFQQFAGEMKRRDEELARMGLTIEVSKEPQKIYYRQQKKKKIEQYKRVGLIILFLVFLIVLPIGLTRNRIDDGAVSVVTKLSKEQLESKCSLIKCLDHIIFNSGTELYEVVFTKNDTDDCERKRLENQTAKNVFDLTLKDSDCELKQANLKCDCCIDLNEDSICCPLTDSNGELTKKPCPDESKRIK
eukprot:snap_masked-scaffold_8-processed-gene-14.64-mRNA-1 protein AED:1.00 eAED:1.00 QI:0/0/0/0/1/1/2/0/266